jgi:hypothetical protein
MRKQSGVLCFVGQEIVNVMNKKRNDSGYFMTSSSG